MAIKSNENKNYLIISPLNSPIIILQWHNILPIFYTLEFTQEEFINTYKK